MRSVSRAFVMMASFAIIAECGRPAFSGPAPPMDEKQIRRWSDWWMNEMEQQYLPAPQLLNIRSPSQEEDWMELEKDWHPNLTLSVMDLYPYGFGDRLNEWHQQKAARLSTAACVLPSAIQYIADTEWTGASWIRKSQRLGSTFSLLRNMRAPATIRSISLSETQYEDGDPLKLNIPKRLSEYGEYLRLLKFVLARRHYPFFDPDRCE